MSNSRFRNREDYAWSRRKKDKEFVRRELDDYIQSRSVVSKKAN